MVEVTLGWSTYTCWKRRSRAGSFSMYLRYSSRVVAPMHRSSPRPSMGFNRLPAPEDNCLVSSRSHRWGGTISQGNLTATQQTMGNDMKQSGTHCIAQRRMHSLSLLLLFTRCVSPINRSFQCCFQSKAMQNERGGIRMQSRSGHGTLKSACQQNRA